MIHTNLTSKTSEYHPNFIPAGVSQSELSALLADMMANRPWYRKWFPWLPMFWWNSRLRTFTFLLWDNSYCAKAIGKPHFFDVLVPHYRKWWQPPVCGFQMWL